MVGATIDALGGGREGIHRRPSLAELVLQDIGGSDELSLCARCRYIYGSIRGWAGP